jgi:hypothetical protein
MVSIFCKQQDIEEDMNWVIIRHCFFGGMTKSETPSGKKGRPAVIRRTP